MQILHLFFVQYPSRLWTKNFLKTTRWPFRSPQIIILKVQTEFAVLIKNGQRWNSGEEDIMLIKVKKVIILEIELNWFRVCLISDQYDGYVDDIVGIFWFVILSEFLKENFQESRLSVADL